MYMMLLCVFAAGGMLDFCFCKSESWCKQAKNKVVKHACAKQREKGESVISTLLLLLSHFSRVRLCVTPQTAAHQAPPWSQNKETIRSKEGKKEKNKRKEKGGKKIFQGKIPRHYKGQIFYLAFSHSTLTTLENLVFSRVFPLLISLFL